MIEITNYTFAVFLCFLAMFCWGSWQNTRNMGKVEWRFELFYWDFIAGILLISLVAALTLGSLGSAGRTFFADLKQADISSIVNAMIGGTIWNIGTLLLTAAIAMAGMSVAFPTGAGLAWILGIFLNYIISPPNKGKDLFLFIGVLVIIAAVFFSAFAYKKLASQNKKAPLKGIMIAFLGGIPIAFFYGFVVRSLDGNLVSGGKGSLTPYTAVFYFSLGAFLSTFIFNPIMMKKPIEGRSLNFGDYKSITGKMHLLGILGGVIWGIGNIASFMAVKAASPAISYGLSNAAPVVAATWGIFVWKEFKKAPKDTNVLLLLMYLCYLAGLVFITYSNA